ncbi:MAG TPA: CHAT domain-containing protein, partial [Polyangiales bacterium]|nr:CHAT domain-containing protein [Polyangiales bacterium]
LKSLGSEAALVSFHELDSGVVALVVADGRVQSTRIAASVRAIDTLAVELSTTIRQRRNADKPLRAAYSALIEPFQASLVGKKALLLVPDGELGTVPFEALLDTKGQRLIEQYEVRYLPAIALLAEQPSRGKAAGLFAMADPVYARLGSLQPARLPDTKEEVEEIEKAVKGASSVWLGTDASETKLKSLDLKKFGYVHLATHGVLAGEVAGYLEPGLLLSKTAADDGVLTMTEAQQLKLSAKLAVLSACDTGRGERIVGEGALSISRAFLLAGAEAVLVSLWPVDSVATKELMVALYAELAAGTPPAQALQRVKLKMLKDDASAPPPPEPRGLVLESVKPQPASYGHPFYWSAFVLVGG